MKKPRRRRAKPTANDKRKRLKGLPLIQKNCMGEIIQKGNIKNKNMETKRAVLKKQEVVTRRKVFVQETWIPPAITMSDVRRIRMRQYSSRWPVRRERNPRKKTKHGRRRKEKKNARP